MPIGKPHSFFETVTAGAAALLIGGCATNLQQSEAELPRSVLDSIEALRLKGRVDRLFYEGENALRKGVPDEKARDEIAETCASKTTNPIAASPVQGPQFSALCENQSPQWKRPCVDVDIQKLLEPEDLVRYYRERLDQEGAMLRCIDDTMSEEARLTHMPDPTMLLTDATLAEELKKPGILIVDYFKDPKKCAPCKKMSEKLTKIAKKYRGRLRVGRIDVQDPQNPKAVKYHGHDVPYVEFFKDGKRSHYIPGYYPEELDAIITMVLGENPRK